MRREGARLLEASFKLATPSVENIVDYIWKEHNRKPSKLEPDTIQLTPETFEMVGFPLHLSHPPPLECQVHMGSLCRPDRRVAASLLPGRRRTLLCYVAAGRRIYEGTSSEHGREGCSNCLECCHFFTRSAHIFYILKSHSRSLPAPYSHLLRLCPSHFGYGHVLGSLCSGDERIPPVRGARDGLSSFCHDCRRERQQEKLGEVFV